MHKFLFYHKFIICLYMFRALFDHHEEVKKLYYAASGIITPVRDRPVRRLRESSLNLRTGRSATGVMILDAV